MLQREVRRVGEACGEEERQSGTAANASHAGARSDSLDTIADTKTTLQQDIGVVSAGLGLLRAEHRKLAEKMMEVEKVVEDMHPAQ
ncbi:hypothetical protein NDU88_008082 [Pleurodeles waltl]|uniref:Uncharacterized protein n=1 Tax=Pleurodeles waltl TaxID=8319 RepID=A0AAV7QRU2_PLEWA|nr:hypothetical protein NDU88_008082 [Pleurodeles waltl]